MSDHSSAESSARAALNGYADLYHELRALDPYRFAYRMQEEGIACAVGADRFEIDPQDDPRKEVIAAVAQEREAELLPVIKEIQAHPSPAFDRPDDDPFVDVIQQYIASEAGSRHGVRPRGKGPDTAARAPLTDLGNAERFTVRYIGRVRYVIERGMWAVWDRAGWTLDDAGVIEQMMKETARSIWNEVIRGLNAAERAEIAKHAHRSENAARIQAALRLAQTEPGIPVHLGEFDADPMAINCLNGLLDLRPGGEVRPHEPTMLVRKRVNARYDAAAACPLWHRFLSRVLPDADVRGFVKRFIGYALTGSTREQGFPIFYGTGANGKTTLLAVIGALMNDYAQTTSMQTFTARRTEGSIPNDLARMQGARFVSAVETNENVRLNEGLVKQLTGGDRISARFLHQEWFDFEPTHKIAISVNHKPVVRGTDHAIWRRIWLVPFTETIPDDEQDKDLKEKLLAELPGIFAWAVEGCRAWQQNGLNPPAAVKKATREYREEMDIVGNWIAECCVVMPNAQARAKDLYASYVAWAEQSGERARPQKEWGAHLTEKEFTREHERDGWYWYGIGLVTHDP